MKTSDSNIKPLALIIEDDRKHAIIFEQALKMVEFETEVIQDGKAALERLATIVPSLVVLDLHLPHISGGEILRQIRAQERLEEVRVILATADPRVAEELQDGCDLVLIKPVSFAQLRDLAARFRPPETAID